MTVPAGLFPGLTGSVLRANRHNLYALYQDLCGVNIVRLEDRVYAIKADAQSARALGVKLGHPLLKSNASRLPTTLSRSKSARTFTSARFHYCADQPGV
jgi:DNA-binding GntR family transcriptional regulator